MLAVFSDISVEVSMLSGRRGPQGFILCLIAMLFEEHPEGPSNW